jgi:hypothetical protein
MRIGTVDSLPPAFSFRTVRPQAASASARTEIPNMHRFWESMATPLFLFIEHLLN